jgi:unsaturated chondroitin disaccharide hydrolase
MYTPVVNNQWTGGFYCGMLNLARQYAEYRLNPVQEVVADGAGEGVAEAEKVSSEVLEAADTINCAAKGAAEQSGDVTKMSGEVQLQLLRQAADQQLSVLRQRLEHNIELDIHDIGFLYTLSAVADYEISGNPHSRAMAITAGEKLYARFNPVSKIIQAWGALDDAWGRQHMIIDTNMNLPLLYFLSQQTGIKKFGAAAYAHIKSAQRLLVRDDASTFHIFQIDDTTGVPGHGATHQGFSDESCWARGQAWGIYGFALSYKYSGDVSLLETACKLADYYLAHLPADLIPYWDLIFSTEEAEDEDVSEPPRDTSAAAITICGLLEIIKYLPVTSQKAKRYRDLALKMLASLANDYTTKNLPKSNGLLVEGVYAMPRGEGVGECTIWGDYFYLEALVRASLVWRPYW